MPFLRALRVQDFRNIRRAEFRFQAQVSVIEGVNGSGKTSLLEAIHVLATGRTFTGGVAADFISRGVENTILSGEVETDGSSVRLGVEKTRSATVCRADGAAVRSASLLLAYLPVLSLDAHLYQMVSNSPAYRRSLLDRTLFHVEQDYLELFKKFHRAMQHRNELLRNGQSAQMMGYWNEEFAHLGAAMDEKRQACVDGLNERLTAMEPWSGAGRGSLRLEYRSGWRSGTSLIEALAESAARESEWKTTVVGPHRAELRITVDGMAARQKVSRGQAKRIACLLVAAQLGLLDQKAQVNPILLIDDLSAELDRAAQEVVLATLLTGKRQAFITTIDYAQLPQAHYLTHAQRFHVEHGQFSS